VLNVLSKFDQPELGCAKIDSVVGCIKLWNNEEEKSSKGKSLMWKVGQCLRQCLRLTWSPLAQRLGQLIVRFCSAS